MLLGMFGVASGPDRKCIRMVYPPVNLRSQCLGLADREERVLNQSEMAGGAQVGLCYYRDCAAGHPL